MNPNLNDRGAGAVLEDGNNASRDHGTGKPSPLPDLADGAGGGVALPDTALGDLAVAYAGFTTSWNLAADAAERIVDVAGKAQMDRPDSGLQFGGLNDPMGASGTSATALPALYDESLRRGYGALGGSMADAGGVSQIRRGFDSELSPEALMATILERYGQPLRSDDMRNSPDPSGFTEQLAKASHWGQGAADFTNGIQTLNEGNAFEFKPLETSGSAFYVPTPRDGDGITPERHPRIKEDFGQDDVAMGGATFAPAAHAMGLGVSNTPLGNAVPAERFVGANWTGLDGAIVAATVEPASQPKFLEFSERSTANVDNYSMGWPIQSGYFDNVHNFETHVFGDRQGAVDDAWKLPRETDSKPEVFGGALEGADDHDRQLASSLRIPSTDEPVEVTGALTKLAAWDETYSGYNVAAPNEVRLGRHMYAPPSGSAPLVNSFASGNAPAGGGIDEIGALAGGEGITAAAGPPGWLVALTGAVVMELSRSGLRDDAGTAGGAVAGQQTRLAPRGTRNDPLHVKLVEQMAPYQTHMPTGTTANLPSQSLPIPGQVLFSP